MKARVVGSTASPRSKYASSALRAQEAEGSTKLDSAISEAPAHAQGEPRRSNATLSRAHNSDDPLSVRGQSLVQLRTFTLNSATGMH